MPENQSEETRLATLTQRVTNIEQSISNLANQFSNFINKAGEQKPPYGLWLTAIGLLFGLGQYWSSLQLDPIKTSLDRMAESVANTVQKDVYDQNRDRSWNDTNVRFGKLEAQIGAMVPRAEHETHWDSENQRFNDQQRQIDEIKSSQANTYSARDIILDLKENQQRLEREISDMKANRGG